MGCVNESFKVSFCADSGISLALMASPAVTRNRKRHWKGLQAMVTHLLEGESGVKDRYGESELLVIISQKFPLTRPLETVGAGLDLAHRCVILGLHCITILIFLNWLTACKSWEISH